MLNVLLAISRLRPYPDEGSLSSKDQKAEARGRPAAKENADRAE